MIAAIHEVTSSAYAGLEAQAVQIAAQQQTIAGVLTDCRAFVARTQTETNDTKRAMTAEVEALQTKLQDIVAFVEKVPDTIGRLDTKLEAVPAWLSGNKFEGVSGRVNTVEVSYVELESNVDRRLRELTEGVAGFQAVGASSFTGLASAPQTQRDRNVFDPRDYKLADLGVKPSMAWWKKLRRDLEGFIDTIRAPAVYCASFNAGRRCSITRRWRR